ncbi:MAG: hypothetical protein ABSF29_04440 [Tepidisphaeraceae bacterium]
MALSADLYNRMVEDIERLDKLSVTWPLSISRGGGGTSIGINLPQAQTSTQETVLVGLIAIEPGGGRYSGTLLSGDSTGSTTTNFQLLPGTTQSATDGPTYQSSGGFPVNNALVINIPEQFVPNSHVLYQIQSDLTFVQGRIMGQTTETPPRTIVYVDDWPLRPCIAKITGPYPTSVGGIYYGKIAQGQFASNTNSYSAQMHIYADSDLPSVENCWIANNWEQVYIGPGSEALAAGTYVWGFMSGFPVGAYPGGRASDDIWYMVYTWFPAQAVGITLANLQTVQTANASYSTNEQNMLNNCKADLTNLRAELNQLQVNMKAAGYIPP